MSQTVLFRRQAQSAVLPSSGDSIVLLSVIAARNPSGSYDLVIEGISRGSAACSVRVVLQTGPQTIAVGPNSSGFFTANLTNIALSPGDYLAVEISNTGSGTTGADAALINFPGSAGISLPTGTVAVPERGRYDYLAGNPDRTVETRFFNQLVLEPLGPWVKRARKRMVYGSGRRNLKVKDLGKLLSDAKAAIDPLWERFRTGILPYPNFVTEARAAMRTASRRAGLKIESGDKDGWEGHFGNTKSGSSQIKRLKSGHGPSQVSDGTSVHIAMPNDLELVGGIANSNVSDAIDDFLDLLLAHDDFQGRIGWLFSDRLRFQPAGIVIGEPIYTMSLSPGEEVELRQVVETKRKSTIEDIIDREQELSLNLTASWSNEITEGLSEQSTVQNAVHVGANSDVKLPIEELPIGFGINVSNDLSTADTVSREHSARTAIERTSTASSKMRSQHKIRMEVTAESSSSLASTRRLRNSNSQRSQTHIFSKVYRKERVTLERYGVSLCLKLTVNDPSNGARSNFLANLDKFDPNNPAHYTEPPKAVVSSKTVTVHYGDRPARTDFASRSTTSVDLNLRADLKIAGGGTVPAAHILSSARLRFADYQKEESEWNIVDGYTSFKETTISDKSQFEADGGAFSWAREPEAGSGNPKGTLDVTLTDIQSDYLFMVSAKKLLQARIAVIAEWVPTQADLDAVKITNMQRWNDLVAACTEDRIRQIRDAAISDYPGQTLAAAVSQQLNQTQNMVQLRHIFDFENAIIESAPYWSSPAGMLNYGTLETRLLALPIPLSINSIVTQELTAPQAIVYIPVFEGHEAEALDLMPGVDAAERHRIVSEIDRFRKDHFPEQNTALPTFDEILSPAHPMGTADGNGSWNTEWEKPQKGFDVVAHWQLLTPTDGVHLETRLSESVVSDEHQRTLLEKQTEDRT